MGLIPGFSLLTVDELPLCAQFPAHSLGLFQAVFLQSPAKSEKILLFCSWKEICLCTCKWICGARHFAVDVKSWATPQ